MKPRRHAAPEPVEPSPLCGFDALLTSTVALMTMWAEAGGNAAAQAARRETLGQRIVAHLYVVAHHPHAPGLLRAALGEAHAHWVALMHGGTPAAASGPRSRLH